MGRQRKYPSNAARQKAYRERLKVKKQTPEELLVQIRNLKPVRAVTGGSHIEVWGYDIPMGKPDPK